MGDGPDPRDRDAALRLGEALESAGYTYEAIGLALGVDPITPSAVHDVQVYERKLRDPSRLHTLIKLFVLGTAVTEREAAEALAPLELAHAQAAGLVESDSGEVRRLLSITTFLDLWLAHDVFSKDPEKTRADHVIGAGPASKTLAALTVNIPCDSAFDLGTGCGVQALLAARHSKQVMATDTNSRALRFAEFNAALNSISGVDFAQGSMFEPVSGRRFDRVVANPPFVISPETRYEYRDSDLPGDAVSREVVRGAAEHLRSGGYATVLCSWGTRTGGKWSDEPAGWVKGIGCDAWVLHYKTEDPIDYAATWLSAYKGPAYGEGLDRWLDYYRELGLDEICTGAVILRRTDSGDGWFRADSVPASNSSDTTEHVLRVFKNQDYLQATPRDEDILGASFLLAADHTVEQKMTVKDGSYQVQEVLVRIGEGLAFVGEGDLFVLRVLSECDGRHRLRDLVREAASMMEVEVAELEPVAVEVIRQMLSLGFLEAPPAAATRSS